LHNSPLFLAAYIDHPLSHFIRMPRDRIVKLVDKEEWDRCTFDMFILATTFDVDIVRRWCQYFRRTLLRYVRLVIAMPVVVCHLWGWWPYSEGWTLRHFASPNCVGSRAVYVNILERNSRGSRWSCKLNERVYEKSRFSTCILLYLANNTRYGHRYNGRRIGTPMRSIERCQF